MNIIIWDYESVRPKVLPQNKYRSLWLYFMVQWFCVISWRLFDVWTSYFGIKGQYDLMFDPKINVGLCDLYFMVQWLCLISPRLFDAWVSYFQIMRQCDPNFDLKSKYKSTWPIFHGLVILLNIFKIIWWMNIIVGVMDVWHIIWPYQVYVGQWPIFYGPAILLHILMEKRCTWDNGSVWLKDRPCKIYVGQWPVSWSIDFTLYHCQT